MKSIHQCWGPQVVIEIAWKLQGVYPGHILKPQLPRKEDQRHEASRVQPRQTWQTLKPPVLGTEVHPEN